MGFCHHPVCPIFFFNPRPDHRNHAPPMHLLSAHPPIGIKTGGPVSKTNEDLGRKERAKFDAQGRVVW